MNFTENDKIGRKDIVERICSLVDNLAKDRNFCLALNGKWGSGKTYVMHMISEQLSQHEEYTIVHYDAWENSFYSEPLIAILSCIIEEIQSKLSAIQGEKVILGEIASESISVLCENNKVFKFFHDVFIKIRNLIQKVEKPFRQDTSNSELKDFQSYKSLLHEVKESLNSITENNSTDDNQGKLIILVDEIDRCLPNEQLKILERLHHLFDVKNCAVICAVNLDSISNNVETVYGVDGNEYLRKFFDFTFKLEMNSEEYLEKLLKELAYTMQSVNDKFEWMRVFNHIYNLLTYRGKNLLSNVDNRELTRYVDTAKQILIVFDKNELQSTYVFFLLICLFLKRQVEPDILNARHIANNENTSNASNSKSISYFDYILKYFDVNHMNLPYDLMQHEFCDSSIIEYIYTFNKIMYLSILDENLYDFRCTILHSDRTLQDDSCILRKILIAYGGEPNLSKNK